MSVNEDILRLVIRRSVMLEQFKKSASRSQLKQINRLIEKRIAKLVKRAARLAESRAYARSSAAQKRAMLAPLTNEITKAAGVVAKEFRGELMASLRELAEDEARFSKSILDKSMPVQFRTHLPTKESLRAILHSRPMLGRFLREDAKALGNGLSRMVTEELRRGLVEGRTNKEIERAILGNTSRSVRGRILSSVERIVRTATTHVSNRAREEVAIANSSIVKGMEWNSTLDARTSTICTVLDGRVYSVGTGPRPPAHPNCRSSMTFITKSWRELGLDIDEVPNTARASLNGVVPADLSFEDWLRGEGREWQEEILGKGAAEIFRRGKLPLAKFADIKNLRARTLEELRVLELRYG